MLPVELELGGKGPMIVFEDADVARAAPGAARGGLTCTGQSCTSVERLYVHEAIYDRLRAALLRIVNGMTQATGVQERIVRDDMTIARAETFGPVLPPLRFRDEDDGVRRTNDSEIGLTASVSTRDLARGRRVVAALAVGGVSINNVMATEANPALPFGGSRNSGFGRYKGEIGLHVFCNVKSLLVDQDNSKIEANWFAYTVRKYELFSDMTVNFCSAGPAAFARFLRAVLKLESSRNKAGGNGR